MRYAVALTHVLAIAAGCGPGAKKPDYPTLDPDRPAPAVEVAVAPSPDPAEFAPPPSSPTGEPVAITWRAPAVGERWGRAIEHDALYSSSWDTDSRRQHTERHFAMAERVAAVDGAAVMRLEVEITDAREIVNLDGRVLPETLAAGSYVVAADPEVGVKVSRADSGFPIGDREREEIQGVYGPFVGAELPVLVPIKRHPLRVGEVVKLSDIEETVATIDGEPATPVHIWLADVTDGVATYHYAMFERRDTETRGIKATFAIETATGRLRTLTQLEARGDTSPTMQSTSRMVEVMRITY